MVFQYNIDPLYYRVMPEVLSIEIEVILTEDITDYILCPVKAEDSGIENTELVTGIIRVHVLQKNINND